MADSHTVSQKVRQADLDVGLILDPQGQAGLSVLAFAELEVGIVMRPDHLAGRRRCLWASSAWSGILCPARR